MNLKKKKKKKKPGRANGLIKSKLTAVYSTVALRTSPRADKPLEIPESCNFSQFIKEAVPHPGGLEAERFLSVCHSSHRRYLQCVLIPERVGRLL